MYKYLVSVCLFLCILATTVYAQTPRVISGLYTFSATSTDLANPNAPNEEVCGVGYIQYFVDGVAVGPHILESPAGSHLYPFTWDSRTVADGPHTVTAKAFDKSANPNTGCGGTNPNSSTSAPVAISVNNAAPTNQPPIVDAGPDQTITLPATATLAGTATDDGLPNNTLTYQWAGPSGVTFSAPTALNTMATFGAAGVFTLTLTANDGTLSANDTIVVNVNPVTTDPCIATPLKITNIKWPTSHYGTRSLTWTSSQTQGVMKVEYSWLVNSPRVAKFTDNRGCTATYTN